MLQEVKLLSENSLIILFEQKVEPENIIVINNYLQFLQEEMRDVIIDITPSYASIHIVFNLLKISYPNIKKKIYHLSKQNTFEKAVENKKKIQIPVYYGEEVALDLACVAERANVTKEEVVKIHTGKTYLVYTIGFSPGFAYLGNVDKRIETPRKETPRKKILKGSVGIADRQTAIYPIDSAAGWQIVGRTPIDVIDYGRKNLTCFSIGNTVEFVSINKTQYLDMGGQL